MITDILSTIANVTGVVEKTMEKAERGEQIETAILAQAAHDLRNVQQRLMVFKHVAETVITDADFAKLVRESFTRNEGG